MTGTLKCGATLQTADNSLCGAYAPFCFCFLALLGLSPDAGSSVCDDSASAQEQRLVNMSEADSELVPGCIEDQ